MDLISNLVDIRTAMTLRPRASKVKKTKIAPNKADQLYDALNCKVELLEKGKEYNMLKTYFNNTGGSSSWSKPGSILEMFKIEREGEAKIFNPLKLKNKKLLWHGSRFSNYVGILSNGMRIAPPEAPKTGYSFGKGVYFADL